MKEFSELREQELLALAITLEEEDNRTYGDYAEGLRATYPGTAELFTAMAEEENRHRHRLLELYREKFGDHIPLIRRQDVKGFIERKSVWLLRPLGLDKVRAPRCAQSPMLPWARRSESFRRSRLPTKRTGSKSYAKTGRLLPP
jgi:hypothetical protein